MKVSVLIPTRDRPTALAATLTALSAQSFRDFNIVIADQGDTSIESDPTVRAVIRILETGGQPVCIETNLPRLGMAHQRQFLLDRSIAPYSLFLDDDIILEPDVLERMAGALEEENCGFAGMALIGLSYRHDIRPHEQHLELWHGPVQPEIVRPDSSQWDRHLLHNAANVLHVARKLPGRHKYKVAWVGGCVLYDTRRLRAVKGFEFWRQLPAEHCGEDVLVQLRMLARYGGFGMLPSGAYHLELPTKVPERKVDAPRYLVL